ncbi:glycerate kinase [Pantanalinema sp. GBBB05]|uniref:glycerate kinase n=1 Tax=Pantanalinema sp. GBBB05 TaxID=2604139 RepID=UPI001D426659|nr:glycerate kinase [Pantanalinema sp. GBBB05]
MLSLIQPLIENQPISPDTWQQLEQQVLSYPLHARIFEINAENVSQQVRQRAELLRAIYPGFCEFSQRLGGKPDDYWDILWNLWLPLGMDLATQRQRLQRPFVQGILGGQGTGKTTLGAVLILILHQLGYQTLSLSLDDLYKTYADRQQLQVQDPRLIWRGPPGTHDVELGIQVLDQLRHPRPDQSILIPRFDKSLHQGAGDRIAPEAVKDVDIILFEGWFVGVRPIDPIQFETAPPPIVTETDRAFARDMNKRLHEYLPLWERLDRLMVLVPIDYRLSKQWRLQAEQQMIASGKTGMSEPEIAAFVDYFWQALHPQLFIPPLLQQADLVIEIQPDHSPSAVYGRKTE